MTAPSALQFEQYAEMSLAHRNPMDADVLTLTHALRHPVSPGEVACDGLENDQIAEPDRILAICRRWPGWPNGWT